MGTFLRKYAALAGAVVTAGVGLLTAFGVQLTAAQVGAITSAVAAISGVVIHVDAVTRVP